MGFIFFFALPFLLGACVIFLGVRSTKRQGASVGMVLGAEGLALAFVHLALDSKPGIKTAYALLSGLTCCTLLYSIYAIRRTTGRIAVFEGFAAVVLGALTGMFAFDRFDVRFVLTDDASGIVVGLMVTTVVAVVVDRLARAQRRSP